MASIGSLVVALGVCAQAVSFEVPARLGDRRVELGWMPEEDDPVFTGNLEVFFVGEADLGAAQVGFLLLTRWGDTLWSLSADGSEIVQLAPEGNDWIPESTLPPLETGGATLTCADLHPSGTLLVAGLSDGRLAIWRLATGRVEMFAGHEGVCEAVAFRPQGTPADSSFVTAGEDGLLRQWARPGAVARDTLAAGGVALTGLGINQTGDEVAVGHADGQISVWSLGADTGRLFTLEGGHSAPVVQLAFSYDGNRLASGDSEGGVQLWNARLAQPISHYTPPLQPDPIRLEFTPRESNYIAYAHASGQIGVLDGFSARAYNVTRQLPDEITAFALHPDGRIGFFGGAAGHLEWWHQGGCIPSAITPECFGGYILWRGVSPDTTELVRLRVYDISDTTWGWTALDTVRVFVDPDSLIPRGGDEESDPAGPHNGIPYYYSLTKYYRVYYDGQQYERHENSRYAGFYRTEPDGDPVPVVPRVDAVTAKPLLGDVYVVPNPYLADEMTSEFGPISPPHVRFMGLPAEATIHIFTVSGDLVRVLHHLQNETGANGGSIAWDLRNDHDRDVTSGVYIYAVDTPSREHRRGFFTVVR